MEKTKVINNATYIEGKISKNNFCSICSLCKGQTVCDEPNKDRRLTCPEKLYSEMNKED